MNLTDDERRVLEAVPRGGGASTYIHVEGVTPQKRNRILARLEQMGLVERAPNGYGSEKPWWWTRLPLAPDEPLDKVPVTVKGTIYDRAGTNVVTFECNGEVNEFGCAVGYLKAGENNARKAWVPLHLLHWPWWSKRRRGEVTTWSSQFSCPVHGECSVEMVRTDKCCALCGSLLNRHDPTV